MSIAPYCLQLAITLLTQRNLIKYDTHKIHTR